MTQIQRCLRCGQEMDMHASALEKAGKWIVGEFICPSNYRLGIFPRPHVWEIIVKETKQE